ncbi:MAG: hypothetical protein ACRD12_13570 [Acidimicrobiales bacterium]
MKVTCAGVAVAVPAVLEPAGAVVVVVVAPAAVVVVVAGAVVVVVAGAVVVVLATVVVVAPLVVDVVCACSPLAPNNQRHATTAPLRTNAAARLVLGFMVMNALLCLHRRNVRGTIDPSEWVAGSRASAAWRCYTARV